MGKILVGNCLEVMKDFEDNKFDSVVTDPPYGLSFMGKGWDHGVPGVEYWIEVLRVAKPGAFLLAFGGTRKFHRLAVAIEDAGWEIRDTIGWLYGSGFPKSHNIGKAVDRLQGNDRVFVESKKAVGFQQGVGDTKILGKGALEWDRTKDTSEWEGWGTSLKPACEYITMARKPFVGTVADNVLKYGTGGINIDGCRVGVEGDTKHEAGEKEYNNEIYGKGLYKAFGKVVPNLGRFPANIIHDGSDEVLAVFPDNKGAFAPVKSGQKGFGGEIYGKYKQAGDGGVTFYDDGLASASRFFYCAKASKQDREENNNHPTVKPTSLMRYLVKLVTRKGGLVLDPFCGSGSTCKACVLEGCDYIGIDLDAEYCEIAEKRVDAVTIQTKLWG